MPASSMLTQVSDAIDHVIDALTVLRAADEQADGIANFHLEASDRAAEKALETLIALSDHEYRLLTGKHR